MGIGLYAPASSPAVEIHAHRGGPNVEGQAMFGENSMSAFRHSAEAGHVIELDLGRTSDGVTVSMHDKDLNRTTDCEGDVVEMTWADLSSCRIDRIGIGDARENLDPGDPRLEAVPRLSQVIDLLKETGAEANIEVKSLGSNDLEFPNAVYTELAASGLPSSQVILQTFSSRLLKDARSIYPGVTTSQLAVNLSPELDQLSIDLAVESGSAFISPEWPMSETFITGARTAGLLLAPWTIDDPVEMQAAADLGVDAVITNDPTMADRLIGTEPEVEPEPAAKLALNLSKGKVKSRPGGKMLLKARISNTGDARSGKVGLKAFKGSAALKLVGKWPRTVSPLKPGQSRTVKVKLKVKPKTRKTGSFKVSVRLTEAETKPIKRSVKVKVLRSRR
ncbi:MAG: glycerophosphodiester phosphodiesterase family protein [Solirubrobacterales bacterium]